ncbi:MAG: glycosyltransferase family 39 protein [Rikenellaceae bacterium]|nr:glycosyltransferase family 39 protein [Rikenellaceae bacterium]
MTKPTGKTLNPQALLGLMLGAWWVVNLVQAAFTGLANDEAYYHMFAQHLAWGYFDHPPMTALLVRLGSWVGGELGVRLLATTLQPLYLFVLWLLVRPAEPTRKDVTLYMALAAGLPILQLYGFLAVPDGPLMLFTALFLLFYRRFSERGRWADALWMGAAMAALAYSKYHGALVVLIAVAANMRLLRSPRFWAACLLALMLIVPHLLWQYGHDWVSFRYHLSGRNRDFDISYVTEYLLNVVAVFNPLFVPLAVAGWIRRRTGDIGRRAMYWIVAGFLVFFLLSSIRGYVQPQWVIPITFGVIALLFDYARVRPRAARYLKTVALVTIGLVVCLRVLMLFPNAPVRFEVFGNEARNAAIAAEAGDLPVLFDGSYTGAAKYNFYTGNPSFAQPTLFYRTSQYELMDDDTRWIGRRVVVQTPGPYADRAVTLPDGTVFRYRIVDDFRPVRLVDVRFDEPQGTLHASDTLRIPLTMANPYPYDITVDGDSVRLAMAWRKLGTATETIPVEGFRAVLPAGGTIADTVVFAVPDAGRLPAGRYQTGFTLLAPPLTPWFCGQQSHLEIR